MTHPALCATVSRVSPRFGKQLRGETDGYIRPHFWKMEVLTEAFERGVSVELRLGGALIGGWQLSQVVQGVVEGGLGFGVVVFTGKQGASSCQLSIVHPRGAFCRDHREKTTVC